MSRPPSAARIHGASLWRSLWLLPLLASCAGGGVVGDVPADRPAPLVAAGAETVSLSARLPTELLGLRRGATEAFALPRLGPGLTVRYAPETGGAVASILLVARGEPGIAGEDPRQPAVAAEFDRMLAEALAFAEAGGGQERRVTLQEQFVVALAGRPLVRCARLVEAGSGGEALNGLRCLGVAQARFVRIFLTAAPGAMELRRAAGFAALATAALQEEGGAADAAVRPPEAEEGAAPPGTGPAEDAPELPQPPPGPRLYRT